MTITAMIGTDIRAKTVPEIGVRQAQKLALKKKRLLK